MYQRILVPHDGSAFAEQVLPHAVDIARRFDAEIHLLEVIEPPNPALYAPDDMDSGLGAELTAEALDEANKVLREQGEARLSAVAEQLKAEGKLRAYGVSVDTRQDIETLLATTSCSAIEVLFNIFHQEPLPALQQAAAKGVGLIAKVPLDSGWLTGKYRRESQFTDIRKRWSPAVIARRAALVEQLAALLPAGMSLTQAALQYVLAQSPIASAIPGARSAAQLRENVRAAEDRLPHELVQTIYEFWVRELQHEPLPW